MPVPELLLLLCFHSPNDVPPEPQRNVSIAAVQGAVRLSESVPKNFSAYFCTLRILKAYNEAKTPESLEMKLQR